MKIKTIYKIARIELSLLFYSPIAWIILIIFCLQAGLAYLPQVKELIREQDLHNSLFPITHTIFDMNGHGVFTTILKDIYLYIPLLTMGLMSREFQTGSIKLLLSSPVKTTEIIFGKFLSVMMYSLLLIAALLPYIVVTFAYVDHLDLGLLASGLIGLYLLICAYGAIGLFMSCLTSYPVVAAISTFVVLTALNYIGDLWQRVAFVRDITYYLSMEGRAEQFLNGLITSRDLAYFILIITLFVSLSIHKLQTGKQIARQFQIIGRYFASITAALVVGYLTSKPSLTFYLDMTADRSQTLTPASQQIIKQLHLPLKIHTYVNFLDANRIYGMPEHQNEDYAYFDNYRRFKPELLIDYTFYYDSSKDANLYRAFPNYNTEQLTRHLTDANDFDFEKLYSPAQMRTRINLRPEENRFVRQFEYNGRTSFVRLFDDRKKQPGEAEVIAGLKELLYGSCKIAYLTGEGERSLEKFGDDDYRLAMTDLPNRAALVNQGFTITLINLKTSAIPVDANILMIADPETDFSIPEIRSIRAYINSGGNFLITSSPTSSKRLRPIFDSLGIRLLNGTVLHESTSFSPTFVLGAFADSAPYFSNEFRFAMAGGAKVSMPYTSAITTTTGAPYEKTDLLVSDTRNTWVDSTHVVLGSEFNLNPSIKTSGRAFPLAVALTRRIKEKTQKGIVVSDADFMDNAEMTRSSIRTGNSAFVNGTFNWLSNGQYPVEIYRPEARDVHLNLTKAGLSFWKTIFVEVIPLLLAIAGTVLLVARKRK